MLKALRTALFLSAAIALAGCEKSSNIAAMQDEAAGLASHYRTRFEELTKRWVAIDTSKSKADIEGSKETHTLWNNTQRKLAEMRAASAQAQNAIAAAAKSPNAAIDLTRLQADLQVRLERGETEIVANLGAVDAWIAARTYQPKVAVAPVAPDPFPNDDLGRTGIHPDVTKPDDAKHDDAPKTDGKTDAKTDAPKTDAKTDAPKTDAKKDAPKTDAKKDAPKTDAKKDAPKKDAPKAGSGSAR